MRDFFVFKIGRGQLSPLTSRETLIEVSDVCVMLIDMVFDNFLIPVRL